MCSSAFKLLCHVLKKWAAISIKSNHLIGFGIADVILLHCIMFYKVVKAARLPNKCRRLKEHESELPQKLT